MAPRLTVQDKIAYAESASNIEINHLEDFCIEKGLPLQDVTAWSTAYDTGGKLAVQALVVNARPARRKQREWQERVKDAVKCCRPRRMGVTVEGNHLTVDEVKPLTIKNIVYTPLFQLRVVEEGGKEHWFLYWRRAGGAWWPYAGQHCFDTVTEAIAEVQEDPHFCVKLHPMH